MALPFYVCYERKIPELESTVEAAFGTLEKLAGVSISRKHIDSAPWTPGNFGSFSWYVDQALDPARRQARTGVFWELFEKEPWQRLERHYELGILETDLYAEGTNFVFGETRRKITPYREFFTDVCGDGSIFVTGLIQSIHRIRSNYGRNWSRAFLGILLHELGHFYGLPTSRNPNFIEEGDPRSHGEIDVHHCDDKSCIMEQVNISGRMDLKDKVAHVQRVNPAWFCRPDLEALQKNLARLSRM